ncbi:TIR domain-containing protein [Frankia sp. AiPs1]|uniref:caspase family protein n=1 Tax=Frankia sp. AiPa1 TaxID=573492 RepID=UPI00202B537C|nr:caspase family protein [Frankia sp. AiPa1]MCL9759570.1 caspase family protein [Frankia sp. AiPa1]
MSDRRPAVNPMANTHGLVVGIAAYRYVARLPPAAVQDARDVHAVLVDPVRGGHRPGNTRLLLDDAASAQALRGELGDLARRAGPDATVFIYLSGHGLRVTAGQDAGDYLLPVDAVAESGEALARTAISGAEFGRALRALAARRVLVVFDCCHAGGIGVPKAVVAGSSGAVSSDAGSIAAVSDVATSAPGLSERYYEALAAGRGRAVLASSREDESSFVLPGAANSLFTGQLLAGLAGGAAGDDGLVRIFDLFEYVQPRVTARASAQHPVFKAHLEDNFAVARRPAGVAATGMASGVAATPAGETAAAATAADRGGEAGGERSDAVTREGDGFRHDVYVSYIDVEPDATWVWTQLVPRLERAGLRVAVSGDVEVPGVARVVGVERGVRHSRRTLVLLSPRYLADGLAEFENALAQTLGVDEGRYRLVPARIAPIGGAALPLRLGMLTAVNLTAGPRLEREFTRLLAALAAPLPPALASGLPGLPAGEVSR